jgi:hypothetical protein
MLLSFKTAAPMVMHSSAMAICEPFARLEPVRWPLFHLPGLIGRSFLLIGRWSNQQVDDFVLRCLNVPPMEMEGISAFSDHVTQLHLVTVKAEDVYQAALTALRAGVPWAATALVYGWAPDEALPQVRVSCVPPYLSTHTVATSSSQQASLSVTGCP